MGDDVFTERQALATRVTQLSQMVQGKTKDRLPHQSLCSQDGLIDALFVLYDECQNESLRRNKHVQNFLDKANPVVKEVGKLRLSIHDFDVKKVIGRGHFGEVQLVREKRTDNVYAMKTLRKSDTLAQQNVSFFEAERDIMAKASSPWLTKLEYAFQDDKNLYLCMEFHAGGDVLALLARYDDVFEESMAKFYLAELTQAIHALHCMGYCHSDIKPENCLLDRTGHLKLADFGSSAKISETSKTKFRMPVGSPDYLCPELLCALNEGGCRSYGEEVDWWSLGICAFEFLYGFTPFTDPDGLVATTYSNIMNHEQTLEFPEDMTVSRSAVQFIKQLLTSADKRLDYSGIFNHNFFCNIDFSRIRETEPPYIPNLSSSADTSNFDDFEPIKSAPHLETKCSEFSGKNLPFIGFTYTKRVQTERSSILSTENPHNQNRLERKLTMRTQELHDVKGQMQALQSEDSIAKRKLASLELMLKDKEDIIVRVEKERDSHEKEIAEYVSQVASLKRCLELEREARKESNRKAHDSIQEIKNSMKRAQELREGYKNDQLDQHKEFIAELEEQRLELSHKNRKLAKELNFCKEEVRELTSRVRLYEQEVTNVKEESRASLCELSVDLNKHRTEFTVMENTYKEKMENLEKEKEELAVALDEIKAEKEVLQEAVDGMKSAENEKVDMMEKFSECEEKRKSLEIRLRELQQIEGVEQRLTEQLHVKGKRITELSEALTDRDDQIMKLEHQVKKMERNRSRVLVDHQDQIRTLELKIQELDKGRVDMIKVAQLSSEVEEKDQKIAELTETIVGLQESVENTGRRVETLERLNREKEHDSMRFAMDHESLEHELNESIMHKDRLKVKVERLEKELAENRSRGSEDRDKYLDMRIEMRQLKKDHESALAELQAQLSSKTNQLTDAQSSVTSLEQRNASLRLTVEEVRNALAESSHTYEQKILELEREILKLKSDLNSHERESNRSEEMKTDLKMAREQCGSIKQQNKDLANELEKVRAQKTKLEAEIKLVKSEQDTNGRKNVDMEKKLHEIELNYRSVKSDLKDREAQIRDLQLKADNWVKKKAVHEQNAVEMESEIDELSKTLTSEAKHRQELSVSNKKLTKELEIAQNKLSEVSSELDHLRRAEHRLNADCSRLQKENSKLEMDLKNSVRRLQHQDDDIFRLKEETSQLITEIKSFKASNFTLTQNLENAMDKYDNLNAEKVELENQLETNNVNFEHDKFKLESTIAQQSKLISFLQAKTETPHKKKKNIFGPKPKEATAPLAPCAKALQQSLDVERNRNEDLKRQITKLKSEIHQLKTQTLRGKGRSCAHCDKAVPTSPSSTAAMSALVLSPSNQSRTSLISNSRNTKTTPTTPIQRPSQERMHHNIPHRFQTGINTRATKCAVCLGSINFVRQAAKCQECSIVCHPKCTQSLPASCGLPTQYMQHFTQAMTKKVNSPARVLSTADIRSLELTGWMKLPKAGKQAVTGWEKKWVMLEGDNICIYDKDDDDSRPLDTFCLYPKESIVSVCSAVHASELNQTASTDLPYILKLESQPKSGNLPGRILYLMALSFNEKQKWVASLEVLLSDDSKESESSSGVHGHTLCTVSVDMNCALRLDDYLLLLGCEEGLYVLDTNSKSKPVKLQGVDSVYQLQKVGQKLLLIAGNQERELLWIDLHTVQSRASQACRQGQASLLMKSIKPQKVESCTLFQSAVIEDGECICAATTDKILILKYNQGLQNFGLRKEITTTEPCSCITFTDSHIIVGTDKVYTISLDYYNMKELLDREDKSLAFAIFGASSYESYPLAIHRVESLYLLCFHEFGVFVDARGRRGRRHDLKWTGLPLTFIYSKPYLYVTYFNSVQAINVVDENCFSRDHQGSLELPSPRYLGPEPRGGSIYLSAHRGSSFDLVTVRGDIEIFQENKENQQNSRGGELTARRRYNSRRLSFGNKRIITTSQSTLSSELESSGESETTTECSYSSPPKRKRPY